MKPNFALGLTDDGITLWHRDAAGWLRVGAVPPDSADMDTRMRALVDTAHTLAPEGLLTKLVIPDDQILFCDLAVHGATEDRKREVLRGQLAGRTPYPVEELVFDWVEQREGAHVAVVARETVQEAEEFAAGYGLNPVSAVAAPASAHFAQEPFFCATRNAKDLINAPERLAQHRDTVREAGKARLPAPKPSAPEVTTPAPKAAAAPAEPPEAKPATDPSPATQVTKDKTTARPEGTKAAKQDSTASSDARGSDAPVSDPPVSGSAQKGPPEAAKPERIATSDKTQRNAAQARKSALLGKLLAARETRPAPDTTAAATAKPAFAEVLQKRLRPGKADTTPQAGPVDPPDAVAAFQSRRGRAADSVAPPVLTGKDAKPAARNLSVFPAIQRRAARGKTALKSLLGGVAMKRAAPATGDSAPDRAASPGSALSSTKTSALTQKMLSDQERASSTPKPKPDGTPSQRRDPLTTLRDHGAARSDSEADRLTIFGARNHAETGATGGQRALMILGGVALLLVAVALWAVYLQSSRPAVVEIAEDAAVVAPPPADIAMPNPAMQEASPLEDIEAALGLEDAAQQPPLSLGDVDMADSDISAQPRPDMLEPQSGRIAGLRSAALLSPVDAAPLPAPPAAPAPFGSEPLPPTRAEIARAVAAEQALAAEPDLSQSVSDSVAEALAAQPPESTLPAGEELLDIAIVPGQPASVPPARPDGLVSEAELAALRPDPVPDTAAASPADAALADAAPAASTPLAVIDPLDESALEIVVTAGRPSSVPPARPDALAPEIEAAPPATTPDPAPGPAQAPASAVEAETDDQASLATPPPGGVALTALRPIARPDSLEAAVEATPPAPDFANASALAVATSRQPGARPSEFAAVVQRAMQSAAAPASTAQTARPAAQAPVQTASAAVAAPAIPTSASVAREATQTRAINLRQINLIGVMGTSSNRRALVRLSNGRIVTVRIGESLDGGQVTAIGDTELRYNRRGRDVVLRLAS